MSLYLKYRAYKLPFPHLTTFLSLECTSGIPFISHPDETTTAASKVIGAVMAPAFWLNDKIHSRRDRRAK